MDCYIKQLRDNDCAFASLKMLMAYYSKNKDYLFLKQDLDRENYSLWDIIQIAKKYGIEIQGVKISNMRKRFTLDYQPFLALFKDSNNENGHLVFVRKIKKNTFSPSSCFVPAPALGQIPQKHSRHKAGRILYPS